jgi:hypothetical protein
MFMSATLVGLYHSMADAQMISADHPGAISKRSRNIEITVNAPAASITDGETPYLIVTVKNITNTVIRFPSEFRIRIDGANGEPATTLYQRQVTHTLKPGEPVLDNGGFQNEIQPGGVFTMKYDLSKFYKLSAGDYHVFIELRDDNGDDRRAVWVRSDSIPLILH